MKKALNLTINKHCTGQYNSFLPTKTGGFCDSCQRNVIDFTGMKDSEISEFFISNNGKVCGRFKGSQLKSYPIINIYPKKKNYIHTGLFSVSLITLISVYNANAQNNLLISSTELSYITKGEKNPDNVLGKQEPITIEGIIIDEELKEPIAFANVVLKGTDKGTVTDIDGNFIFPTPLNTGDTLVFQFIGYHSKEYVVTDKTPKNLNIVMKMSSCDMMIMGEVSVDKPYTTKPTFFGRIKNLFR